MDRHPFLALAGALLVSVALAGPVQAAGSSSNDDDDSTSYDSGGNNEAYNAGMAAANAGNWGLAVTKFTIATTDDPSNADAFNMLAYSHRNNGNYDQAFYFYDKALSLDPDHADAHEYVGEAYLAVNDLAKAEEHLAALDDICWLGCEQLDELEDAIEAYKASQ